MMILNDSGLRAKLQSCLTVLLPESAVADLAMVLWVPWNPPYLAGLTISLVLKSTDC